MGAQVLEEIQARVAGTDGWCDPHNKGIYTIDSSSATAVALHRKTGNGKYTDKMILSLSASGSGCEIQACSESQVTSVLDYSTNYCNLHDLYCGSKNGCRHVKHDFAVDEKSVDCSSGQHDASACAKTCGPSSPTADAVLVQAAAEAALAKAAASDSQCPGSSAWIHAKCKMSVTFPTNSCADVAEEIKARVAGKDGWCDPHNKGVYTLDSSSATTLALHRKTGNGKYTDKQVLTLSGSGQSCEVVACSESQVTSVKDFSTNYCNLHDLYCGSDAGCRVVTHDLKFKEDYTSCSQNDASQCLKTCGPSAEEKAMKTFLRNTIMA